MGRKPKIPLSCRDKIKAKCKEAYHLEKPKVIQNKYDAI